MTPGPRVLHLIDSLGVGGAERSLQELLPGLESDGIISQIACLHRPAEGIEAALVNRFAITWLPTARTDQIRQVRDLVKREHIQIVHTSLFNSDIVGRLAARNQPAKVLTTLVNTPYVAARATDPAVRRSRLEVVRQIDGFTARHFTDHFLAISQAVKDHCVSTLRIHENKVTVIPRGRDVRRLGAPSAERRARTRMALGVRPDQSLVVNVARQEHQKGQAVLIQAYARLLKTQPNAVLVIAGRSGTSTPELRRLAETCGVASTITWLGHCDDIPDLLAGADVFAFPSLYEGLGGSLLEAMALGVPIVASDIPAIAETAPANVAALLVPTSDPDALARAIARVLSDRELTSRLSMAGRRRFLELYTLEEMTARTSSLYRDLLR